MPIIAPAAPRPRSGTINTAVAYSGIGRSSLYMLAVKHPTLMKKLGDRTLIDFDVLDQILNDLPPAVINVPSLFREKQQQPPPVEVRPQRRRRRKRLEESAA
jgi:hypothetical protein